MKQKNIVAVVGSLRKASWNRQLAERAEQICKGRAHFEVLFYEDIPYMNEDLEHPEAQSIRRVRDSIRKADGVWFFTPEYNHSFPGLLKNLLDWLSRPDEQGNRVLVKKKAAVSGITPGMSGTAVAQDQLVMLLSFLDMNIMNQPRLTIADGGTQVIDDVLTLQESLPFLSAQAEAFLAFLEA